MANTRTSAKSLAELEDEAREAKARADHARQEVAAEKEQAEAERQARVDEWDDRWIATGKERGAELDRQEQEGFRRFPDDLAAAFAGYIAGRSAQLVRWHLRHDPWSIGLPADGVQSELPDQVAGWNIVERLDGILESLAREKADELLEQWAAERRAVVEGES